MEALLEVGPADRRRRVCAKRQRAAAPVREHIHLLLNHVRTGTGGACEELGLLEDGRLDSAVAVERAEALDLAGDVLPERLLRRQDVVCPARRLELRAHEARSSARNGLRASSPPSVVAGPWPE